MHILKRAIRVLRISIASYASHNCLALSASISFYAMFSFFPLVLLTVSIFATVAGSSEEAMSRLAGLVSNLTPVGAATIMGWVRSVGQTKPLAWGLGLIALIWGARSVFHTLAMSASVIWGRKGWKDVLLRQLVALLLVGVAALMLLASLFLPGLIEQMARQSDISVGKALRTMTLALPYALSFITFATVYFLTTPRSVQKRKVWLSAAVVSLTWEIAKNAFLIYMRATRVSSAYGSIGGVIVLMTWVYLSSAIILWGMELVAAMVEQPSGSVHLAHKKRVVVIE